MKQTKAAVSQREDVMRRPNEALMAKVNDLSHRSRLYLSGRKRKRIEVHFIDGTKRFITCHATRKHAAMKEIHAMVHCLEKETGEKVLWRFTGEHTYYLGTEQTPTTTERLKDKGRKFLDFFFDLDEEE